MRKGARWVIRGALAVGVGALLAWAMIPKPVEVETAVVARGPMEAVIEGQGRTRVRERHLLAAPVPGLLRRITLRAGDSVKTGDPLAVIVPAAPVPLDARSLAELEARHRAALVQVSQGETAVAAALAAEAQARRDLERIEALAGQGTVTARDLEVARTEAEVRTQGVRQARLAVETARSQADAIAAMLPGRDGRGGGGPEVTVSSPVDGRVLRVVQEAEGPVAPGTPLIEVGDPGDLELVVDLPTARAVQVRPGSEVRLTRWGGDHLLMGRVRLVEPSGFTKVSALGVEEQRVLVVVDPDPGPEGTGWGGLGDGFQAEAAIVTWSDPSVIQVPEGAVFRHGDSWAAFVVREGRAVRQTFVVGHRDGRQVEVLSGLQEGDRVVLFPGDRVTDGVRVREVP
ncbi:MAG TPA: HlyD family efflux transporter periplasmic adaptor subunit [Myxococcota bacterium]|nr:HlyD family efflux transporter periplasmic adaptor subunit [Myxococcota bacterium]HQK51302.1 HlyD family efflux transporter periplasmic adaptor subunit [Myxococcota bacterium]